ncbi:MAG: hypothetical protein ACRD25_07060 [Terracidiphilus sp.]
MRFPTHLLLCGTVVVPAFCSPVRQNITPDSVAGFVTRAASSSDFDVSGIRIRCGNRTTTSIVKAGIGLGTPGCPQNAPYVGESATIKGAFSKRDGSFSASEIDISQESQSAGKVSGSALISKVSPSPSANPAKGGLLVRADGYRILIPSKATIVWGSPLHSFADVKADDWIDYKGERRADGIVMAEELRLLPLAVGKGEEKYRAKRDFDPSKVPASAKQSAASMDFLGVNPKRFPPYHDPQMQARVNEIGSKLIPAWQKALPDSDPAKVHFRFQLISTTKFRDALALSSGVILVPKQVVARMQNDAQLAAVLADNIASVLERQSYRHLPAARRMTAGEYATDAAAWLVPGLGLAAPALFYGTGKAMLTKAEDQRGRVALGLIYDAGYDIDQAPMAWWLLAPKKPKSVSKIPLPHRAAYLYGILGECWNSPQAATARQRNH